MLPFKLINMKRLHKELVKYLSEDNALQYDPKEVGHKSGYTDELKKIALYLCGGANFQIAFDFMEGSQSNIDEFFDNVKFNGKHSVPVIVKAIQIHIWNRKYED